VLYIYLAMSGGEVLIPDGETLRDIDGESKVDVLDAQGRVLVTFQREDVSLLSHSPLPGGSLDDQKATSLK
jgi:hypothetical protein